MNRDLQNTKSLTHLDTSLTSFKDMKSLIYEQFQEQESKTNKKIIQPTQYENILNELKNYKMQQNKLKQNLEKQLIPFLIQEQCQTNSNQSQTESKDKKHEIDQFEMEYEQQIMLEEQLKNLRWSTDMIKKKSHPLGHQIQLLKLQERQALDEEQIAQYEMKKIGQQKQQLKSQLERLRYQREEYLDFVRQQCQEKEDGRKITQQNFEQLQMKIESLKEIIRTQQYQIEELNQQQEDKIEQSEQQLITIKNYQSILKIYEYCINLTEKLELSVDQQEDKINSLENIPNPTILPTLESDIGINNFFSTQIPIDTAQPLPNSIHSSMKKRKKSLIENQKILVSQVRQDISINIMEEIVLKNFKEELMIQSQYTDQHTQMVDQIHEYQQEIKLLDEQLQIQHDFTDKIVNCEGPQVDNFNQNVITKNIKKTSIVNYLENLKQIDKQNKIEELFFTLNSRAFSLVKRLCCMLEDIYIKSENISRTVIKTFQRILNTINLMKEQNMNFDLSEYPEFRQLLKSKNLTIIYCDVKIFEQFKLSLNTINEQTLIENFDSLCDMCLVKIASETQFIYEQVINVYQTLRDEIERLLNYGSLKSCRDLNNIPIQIQLTNNMAARKIKEYTDSKISDLTSNRRAKLIFVKDSCSNQPILESLANEDNIDDFYYKVKKDLAYQPYRKTTNTDNYSQSKTTLVYENINNSPMQELMRQNKKFSESLKQIQQQSQYIDDKTQQLRIFLESEQKNLENMNKSRKLSRAPSSSLGLLTTNRPETQERTIKIEKRQISTATKFRSQNRVISEQFLRDSNRLRIKMQKIQQLKLNK